MKRTLFILISIALSSCLLAAKCKKDNVTPPDNPYGLPNATQTGADVFAFRENGSNIIYKENSFSYKFGRDKNDTVIAGIKIGTNVPPAAHSVIFELYGNITTGKTYNLEDSTQISCRYQTSNNKLCQQDYYGFYPKTGTITFTKIDLINKILSGRFNNIKIPVDNCISIDTLNITDGRFDLHYYDNFPSTQ